MSLTQVARRLRPALAAVALVAAGVVVPVTTADATVVFSISKTAPSTAQVGDEVTYQFVIANNSTAGEFIVPSVSDPMFPGLNQPPFGPCGLGVFPGGTCTFTADYTVQLGDVGTLTNTVTATDALSQQTVSGSHSMEVTLPPLLILKTGPATAAVGETVTYTYTIINSTATTLSMVQIDDDVIGDLSDEAPAACDSLAPGASCTFTATYTVTSADPDPLINDVLAEYTDTTGSPFSDTARHSVDVSELIIQKTGPASAPVGATVTYDFTIMNTGDETLMQVFPPVDDLIGPLTTPSACTTLGPGASCTFSATHTVAGPAGPLTNTVSATYVFGFFEIVSASASHTLQVFAPSVMIEKTGPASAPVGQQATYGFTITNTSSPNSPDLILDSVGDDVLGDLSDEAPAACDSLAPNTSCTFTATRTVTSSDPDPLVNEVTVHYHPEGFPTPDVTASDTHSLDVAFLTIDKNAKTLSTVGDDVPYEFTITNHSGAPLNLVTVTDTLLLDLSSPATAAGCAVLGAGQSCTFTSNRMVLAGDPDPLDNTVTAVYAGDGGSPTETATDFHSIALFEPSVAVTKTGPATAGVGELVTYTVTIDDTSSADSPALILDSVTDSLLGPVVPPAACTSLDPGESCTFELTRTVLPGDPDPLGNTVTVHYHPAGFDNDVTASGGHTVDLIPAPAGDGGSLTVAVVGGDPTFALAPDPLAVSPFILDEGEEITFEDLPVGVYTVTMTDLEDDLVLDAIDCIPEEDSFSLAGRSVTFTVVDDADMTCTFTVSEVEDDDPYDGYDDDPGDPDFDFDTPFEDDDDPAPVVEVAGENANNQNPAQQPVAPVVLPETAAPAPETAPAALDTLPRTGSAASNMTILAGLFLSIGGLALVAGRRRKTSQA